MAPLFLIIALVVAAKPESVERIPVGERDSLSVEIMVPAGWTLIRHPPVDSFRSHREVVFAINNRGIDSLCVGLIKRDLPDGGRQFSFGPEAFEEQLAPGTVYLELDYQVGGPPPMSVPYAWEEEEQPPVAIRQAVREGDPDWTTRNVVIHRARFVHWGRQWEAIVAARKPFSKQDLETALAALGSLNLPDRPVGDPRQAVEIAISALPPEVRDEFKDDPKCGCCRLYDVVTAPIDTGYHVTFNLKESQTRRLLRSTSVAVDRDGRSQLR